MALARKYEAATEHGLFKALKEFRAVQADPSVVVEVEKIEVEISDEPEVVAEEVSEAIEAEDEAEDDVESNESPDATRSPIEPAPVDSGGAPGSNSGFHENTPRSLYRFIP